MIQKALLLGSIAAITVLFAINLTSHRPEAFFIMGWMASKTGNLEYAARMFETWIESSKTESKTKDRLRIADGSALSNLNFDKEAVEILSQEPVSVTWEEKKRLESQRLFALWNARAKDSLTYDGAQKKMQLYGALVAYTGAYRLSGDADAQANYEIVEKLFKEHVEEEKSKGASEDEKSLDSGGDSRKSSDAQEGWSKDGEKSDEKQPENAESQGKWEGQSGWSWEKESENGQELEDGKSEPPKSGNWTNAGNPATLNSDPGGTRGSNGSVPLSEAEREELESNIRALSELQREREKFVRPDGQTQTQSAIPNSLRELFSGDPLFDSLIPKPDEWKNGKSW